MNVNLPPLSVLVNKQFTQKIQGFEKGIFISVRALKNQALQFSVLLESGALYTGLPIHAITTKPIDDKLLNVCQPYDAIDNIIQVLTFETLRYMPCSVKLWSDKEIVKGKYLFTVDFIGNDLSRHPVQWKQFHLIELDCGHLVLYPQYRVQFLDTALAPKCNETLPKYEYNDTIWLGEI